MRSLFKALFILLAVVIHALWFWFIFHLWKVSIDYPVDTPKQVLLILLGTAAGILGGVLVFRRARKLSDSILTSATWGSTSSTGAVLALSFPSGAIMMLGGRFDLLLDFILFAATIFCGLYLMPKLSIILRNSTMGAPNQTGGIGEQQLAYVVLFLFTGMIAWFSYEWAVISYGAYNKIHSKPSLEWISKRCDIKFPPNTVLKHSYYYTMLEAHDLRTEIELDKTDIERLLKSLPSPDIVRHDKSEMPYKERQRLIKQGVSNDERLSKRLDWWQPGSARRLIIAHSYSSGPSIIEMVINMDDPKRATIFIFWTH